MAWVTVGHSHIGFFKDKVYEPNEGEDEEFEERFGSLEIEDIAYDETAFNGYMIELPVNVSNRKIKLGIYTQAGNSDFILWRYGQLSINLFPVAFIMDSRGNILEVLNKTYPQICKPYAFEGWITCELELTREVKKGEYLFGGFYYENIFPAWDDLVDESEIIEYGITGTPAWSLYFGKSSSISDEISILSNNYYSKFKKFLVAFEFYSIYFQYDDAPASVSYTRSLAASVVYSSSLGKKLTSKKNVKQSLLPSSKLTRKQKVIRKTNQALGSVTKLISGQKLIRKITKKSTVISVLSRKQKIYRNYRLIPVIASGISRKQNTFRKFVITCNNFSGLSRKQRVVRKIEKLAGVTSSLRRYSSKFVRFSEKVLPSFSSNRKMFLFRSGEEEFRIKARFSRTGIYKRSFDDGITERDFSFRFAGFYSFINQSLHTVSVKSNKTNFNKRIKTLDSLFDSNTRKSELIRNEESNLNISFSLFAGRIIFRIISSAFSLWDWLKGKIREENCIVDLFCPVTDELILECRL